MTTLLVEPFAGIAGDMTVAALLDLGMPLEHLRESLAGLPLEGYEVSAAACDRGGFRATRFTVRCDEKQPHRGLAEIREVVNGGTLPPRVISRALEVFAGLAAAEGAAHGLDPEEVHFHEVGAVDAIVDIVGAAVGLEYFDVDRVLTGRVRVGTGETVCRHGRIPVPAPATVRLLRDLPILLAEGEGETTTPTGAALLGALAVPLPPECALTLAGTGLGAGAREDTPLPNVLRISLADDGEGAERDGVVEIDANLDDVTPEVLAAAAERLLEAGALDVWMTPVVMKKGRAGTVLSLLAEVRDTERLSEAVLRETTTFGVRRSQRSRLKLSRRHETVATPWGEVRVKVGALGGEVITRAPEYEDCARLARDHGVPVRRVYEAALRS